MRFIFLILFLPVMLITTGLHSAAQGSLGDPLFTFDFGSGPNPGPPLPPGITNMTYTNDDCPEDGSYSIINSFTPNGACQPIAWHQLTSDHTDLVTGGTNGYLMLINASIQPSVFFTYQTPAVLCGNTEYQFSAYILNLITPALAPESIEPNITFTVTAPDGTVLNKQSTGSIPASAELEPWVQYSINFNSLGYSYVIVTMNNNAPGGGGNDLALDDIAVQAYGPAISTPTFSTGSGTTPICVGDRETYNLTTTVQQGVYTNSAYQWQENINNAGWVDMPGQTQTALALNTEFYPATTAGTYQFRLGVAEATNINTPLCRVYSAPTVITVNPIPVATVSPTQQAECPGSILTLTASGGTTYQWTGPNMQPTTQNPLVISNLSAADAGTYKVTAFSQYSCASMPAYANVVVFPKTTAVARGSTTICEGNPTPISASGGISYSWSPGATLSDSTASNPIASPTDTTTYTVTVTDGNGCTDTASVTINVLKAPVAYAGKTRYIYKGESVQINATEKYAGSFYWTPTKGLSDPNILNPVVTPASDIRYTLHVNSAAGCGSDTSSIFIRVYQYITIPNTFSPNNDGINDLWDIAGLNTYPESLMLIYDRYGQQIFKSIGYSKPWDGTYDGKPVPPGTYYYVLDLKNNTPKMAGYVMVVR